MNYVPGFAPDGRADWQELNPLLQELVLDEMERLAHNPPAPPKAVFLTDFVHQEASVKHYVWMRYVVDRSAGRITVTGISHYARVLPRH